MTPSGRLSTLSSGQGPGFEWQGSVQSDWPHSSLSPPSSTALQGGSWCCSSCSGRPSPGPPGCETPLRSCCCPQPSSPGSRLRGSPRWPDTPEWHCPAAALHWRGGGRSGWAAPHPLEEREGRKDKGMRMKENDSTGDFLWCYQMKQKNFYCWTSFTQCQTISRRVQVSMWLTRFTDNDYWWLLMTSSRLFLNVRQWITRPWDDSLLFKLTELKHWCENSSNLCRLFLSLPLHHMKREHKAELHRLIKSCLCSTSDFCAKICLINSN